MKIEAVGMFISSVLLIDFVAMLGLSIQSRLMIWQLCVAFWFAMKLGFR